MMIINEKKIARCCLEYTIYKHFGIKGKATRDRFAREIIAIKIRTLT